MRAVFAGLALVALAAWGSHQLDPQRGLDIAAMVHAEELRTFGLKVGGCLSAADGGVVGCDSSAAKLRALRTTAQVGGSDCPQPQTTALIVEKHLRAGTETYWCMGKA